MLVFLLCCIVTVDPLLDVGVKFGFWWFDKIPKWFFRNSIVASCETIWRSMVFLEGELVPLNILGTLEVAAAEGGIEAEVIKPGGAVTEAVGI